MRIAPVLPFSYIPSLIPAYAEDEHSELWAVLGLAHLISVPGYAEGLRNLKSDLKIMDNSFFELGYSLPLNEVIEAAYRIDATHVVLPDGMICPRACKDVEREGMSVMFVPTNAEEMKKALRLVVEIPSTKLGISTIHARRCGFKSRLSWLNYEIGKLSFDEVPFSSSFHFLGLSDNPWSEIVNIAHRCPEASIDSSLFVWPFINEGLKLWDISVKAVVQPIDFDCPHREEVNLDSYLQELKTRIESCRSVNTFVQIFEGD